MKLHRHETATVTVTVTATVPAPAPRGHTLPKLPGGATRGVARATSLWQDSADLTEIEELLPEFFIPESDLNWSETKRS